MRNVFLKQPGFKFKISSLLLFIVLVFVAWGLNIGAQIIFPSQNFTPYLISTSIALFIDIAFVFLSIRLLMQNGLPDIALGLSFTKKSIVHFLIGMGIGILTIVVMAVLLYVFIPYHFVRGPLNGLDVLKDSCRYLVGNSLEELIFRGFLLIVLSQLINWPISLVILAVPFGLFHLQGTGFNTAGLNMVATTMACSFIFGLSFILTRSMWSSIAAHASMNIFLHAVSGLDGAGRSVYLPVFSGKWPVNYNLGLWVMIFSALVVSCFLYISILIRDKKEALNYK